MKRKTGRKTKLPPAAPELPDEPGDDRAERIVARPDGFHWLAPDGRQEFGPFENYEAALTDMDAAAEDNEAAVGEALQEAEDEIGIADWIDPETGEPPEGQSPPHLQEE